MLCIIKKDDCGNNAETCTCKYMELQLTMREVWSFAVHVIKEDDCGNNAETFILYSFRDNK